MVMRKLRKVTSLKPHDSFLTCYVMLIKRQRFVFMVNGDFFLNLIQKSNMNSVGTFTSNETIIFHVVCRL